MTPDISVIIPCYNREHTVKEAVMSVLSQDYGRFDVIAIDDNSTDGTRDALESIDDARLKILLNTGPRGAASARNFGAAVAEGTWLGFQDSDDLWLAGKLAAQMALLRKEPGHIAAYCAMDAMDDTVFDGVSVGTVPGPHLTHLSGNLLARLLSENFIAMPTLIVQRRIFEDIGGFETSLPSLEDWDLMIRIAASGSIGYVPETLALRRPSDNSISHDGAARLAAIKAIVTKHAAHYRAHPVARARLQHRVAWQHRRTGDYGQALRHQMAAVASAPWNPRYLAAALYSGALALTRR